MELVRIRPTLNPSTCETKNSDLIPQGDKETDLAPCFAVL